MATYQRVNEQSGMTEWEELGVDDFETPQAVEDHGI